MEGDPVSGPVILGLVGAAVSLLALALNVTLVRAGNPRYGLDLENTFDGGTNIKQLVVDQGRLTLLAASGATLHSLH